MIAVGIDLGTTFSVVAHARQDGSVDVLPDDVGEVLTPSVVHVGADGTATVGRTAAAMAAVDPDRTVIGIKRRMGTEHQLAFDGRTFRPEGISALVLRSLATSAAQHLGVTVGDLAAVISVPAYFGTAEREATAAAAQITGLRCLDLVAEPVAAALSWSAGTHESGTAVVYDLGGGTFDATVVELTAAGPRVVAVDGCARLGGLDVDDRLADLILERYVVATGDDGATDDEEFLGRLAVHAEQVKKSLSRLVATAVPVEHDGHRARVKIDRADLEDVCRDLVDETLDVVERVVVTARSAGAPRPSRVVLVGGSTRMPMILPALERRFGLSVSLTDPDLAVARGAALHALRLVEEQRGAPTRVRAGTASASLARPLRSVLSRALGVKIVDSHDPEGRRALVDLVVPANAPLPVVEACATFSTVLPDQDRVRVEVMEQAGAVASPQAGSNRRVVDGEIVGIPPGLPAGSPITIVLSVGLDGRITCSATEPRSGRNLVLQSCVDGVSDSAEAEEQQTFVTALRLER